MNNKITICIADNHPIVLYGTKHFFDANSKIHIEAQVSDFESLKKVLRLKKIDVLVLDLELVGLERMNDLRSAIAMHPTTKFLIYTSLSEERHAVDVIRMGAAGFISKKISMENLEKAVVRVNYAELVVSESVKKRFDILASTSRKDLIYKKLSTREIEVLRYLSEGKRNKDIAQLLQLDEKTISTYKLRLLNKLGVTNLVDLIACAKNFGIL